MTSAYLSRWRQRTGAFGGYVLHQSMEVASRFRAECAEALARGVALAAVCDDEALVEVEIDGELIQDLLRKKGSALLFPGELVLTPRDGGLTHVELAFPVKVETLSQVRSNGGWARVSGKSTLPRYQFA